MKKYPKQKYPNDEETDGLLVEGELFVQEKLDGGNGRFMLTGPREDTLKFGRRNVVYASKENIAKQFRDNTEWVRQNASIPALRERTREHGQMVFFGEYMTPHTIDEYDWDEIPKFIGFDVWLCERDAFLEPDVAAELFEDIGLEAAPFYDIVTVDEFLDGESAIHNDDEEIAIPQSHYGDVRAEGVMLKNPTTQTYAKIVRDDFKEKNKEVFGETTDDPSGAERLSREYITNQRIREAAHRLVDEGEWGSLQMEMMEDLPEAAIRDMADEEGGNIFMQENYGVDIGEFRSDVSSRCATILRKMINEQVTNSL